MSPYFTCFMKQRSIKKQNRLCFMAPELGKKQKRKGGIKSDETEKDERRKDSCRHEKTEK